MARKMVLVSVILLSAFILFVSCKNDTEPTQSTGQTQADSDMKNKTADTTEPKEAADIKQPLDSTDTGSSDQVKQTEQAVPAEGATVSQDTSSGDTPQAFPIENEYTFKEVPDGTEIVHDFTIQNKGSALLKILKVKAG